MINYDDKFSSIIGVRPNFDDTFNITQEKPDAWKNFISNSSFEINVKKIFHAFLATKSNLNNRKSIWISGTYGTGKSHSTAVVKHLLSDPISEIEDFKKSLADIQLKSMIDDFRKEHRAFPVVLRGSYTIGNVKDMCYEIQKQTREALSKSRIQLSIKTDFEKAISLLDNVYMESFWTNLLKDDLRIYCQTKDDIKKRLEESDKEILGIIDNKYREINDGGFGTSSITKWLKDVQHELVKTGLADHLVIIWDEFTSLTSSQESRSILNTAQDIAEIAKEFDENENPENVFLIVVTHKNPEQTDAYRLKDAEEQKLALARFIVCQYEMQPNTTYHILSSTLNRVNNAILDELIKERICSDVAVSGVIDRIAENTKGNLDEIKDKIKSLYPFHPYTAYLSTFVSRQLGDAERSVFNFLNDEEVGFKKFIKNKIGAYKFMPTSYIWDFFLKINNITMTNGKLSEVINKYNMHLDTIKKKGNNYLELFKTVLLLNALNAVVNAGEDNNERSLVTPNITNIRDCYSGIMMETEVLEILEYLDKNNIIMKTADGIYEVSTAAISQEKLTEFIKRNSEYYNDITKAQEEFPFVFKIIEDPISKNNGRTVRKTNIIYLSTILKNNQVEIQINRKCNEKYAVNVCVFLSHGAHESTRDFTPERNLQEFEDFIRNLSGQEEYKNVIFINLETAFTELYFSRFIDAYSKCEIHSNNNKSEEASAEKKKAQGWLKTWLSAILNDGQVFLAFRGNTELMNFRTACNKISEDYIRFIFPDGLDTLKTAKKEPIWGEKSAGKIAENILFKAKRDDIESQLKGGIQTNIPSLFKDEKNNYVFDNDMNIFEGSDENHPVVKLVKKVSELIVYDPLEPIINIYEKLKLLFEPPYGLYNNPISYAAIAIALRPYIDRLFVASNGIKIDKTIMRDIVDYLFKAATGGKNQNYLNVRFSSEEEIELINELNGIFGVNENGLMNIRWKARKSFDESVSAPIWIMKYNLNCKKELVKVIDELFKFTIASDGTITQSIICSLLSNIKNYRFELKKAILDSKKEKPLFSFVKLTIRSNYNNIDLDDNSIAYIINYLNSHMQDERPYWTEEQVSLIINRAYIELNNRQDGKESNEYGNESPVERPQNPGNINVNVVKKAKEKISNLNIDVESLKNLLCDIIDENEYFAQMIIDKIN